MPTLEPTTNAYTWDVIGNLLSIDGPLSGAADLTRIRYDAMRQTIGVIGPDPDGGGALEHRAVRYTYNGYGLASLVERGTVDSQSDGDWAAFASLEQFALGYDSLGRRTSARFSAGGSTHELTQYSYDAANRLECVAVRMNAAAFASPPGSACTLGTEGAHGPDRITRYGYDPVGRVLVVTSGYGTEAAQAALTQSYSLNGVVQTLADANGNLTTYVYDGFDRLRRIRFPNASGGGSSTTDYEQYSYDAAFNVTEDRRRDGSTIAFTYDALNRAITMAPSSGASVSFGYDNFGRQTSASFSGHTLSFAYDQLSRNISATGPLGTVAYQYDLAGRRTRITWPDAFYAQYDYDLTGAVMAIRENGAGSGPGVLASYTYDNLGRRVSITRGNGATTTYDYNSASRLEELAHDLASSGDDQTLSFTYNAANQTLSRAGSNSAYDWPQPSLGFANYDANGRNQYAAVGGTSFTYDDRGNLTSDGTASYSYDIYNRLIEAGGATLAYDPAGRLYETEAASVVTRFLYDGVTIVGEYDGEDDLLRRYVPGPAIDEPIVWYEGDDTNDRRWLVADRLGSVIAVTNADGEAMSINAYDEYGRPAATNVGRFQYTGQPWLPEAALYHYRARAYDPILGRFMQTDPILYAGGMNIYAYVENDPVNWIDPFGLCGFYRQPWIFRQENPDGSGGVWIQYTTEYEDCGNWGALIGGGGFGRPSRTGDAGGGGGGGGWGEPAPEEPPIEPACPVYDPYRSPTNLPQGYSSVDVGGGRTNVYMRSPTGQLHLTPDRQAYAWRNYSATMRANSNVGGAIAAGAAGTYMIPGAQALGAWLTAAGLGVAGMSQAPPPPGSPPPESNAACGSSGGGW